MSNPSQESLERAKLILEADLISYHIDRAKAYGSLIDDIKTLAQALTLSHQQGVVEGMKKAEEIATNKTFDYFKDAHPEYNKGYEDCSEEIAKAIESQRKKVEEIK